jgi:DNA-binding NarL/FixJ family response regulator
MSEHPRPVRVTVVDDHVLFAESVALTLEAEGYLVKRLDIATPPATLASVLAVALRSVPRVVLLDLDLGRVGDGTRLIAPLTAAGASVVALTGSTDLADWGECLRQGAKTVLSKTCPLDEVLATIRNVCEGRPVMRNEERQALIETAVRDREKTREVQTRLDRLTRREKEVLGALMRGDQVREIARQRVVSEATVRTQIKSILGKLEMNSQIAAVGAAFRVGWRPPGD